MPLKFVLIFAIEILLIVGGFLLHWILGLIILLAVIYREFIDLN